jgi:hypothetical protein
MRGKTRTQALLLLPTLLFVSAVLQPTNVEASQEVPFTLEDRDRLIKVEASLQGLEKTMNAKFEQVDQRFDDLTTFLWIICTVFGGLVAVTIGFAVWDRKTAVEPVRKTTRKLEQRSEKIEEALRKQADDNPRLAEILRSLGLM